MRYQLVMQWPSDSLETYDEVIATENLLSEQLRGESEIDGHDFGAGESNMFILTDDPHGTFQHVKAILGGRVCWVDLRVAYRDLGGEDYVVLRPEGLADFRVR